MAGHDICQGLASGSGIKGRLPQKKKITYIKDRFRWEKKEYFLLIALFIRLIMLYLSGAIC